MTLIWNEEFRPDTLEGYVCSDDLRTKLQSYLTAGTIPHLLFFGTAGTGKTTAAKLLIKNLDCDYLFINASDERGIDVIRDKIKNFASTMGFAALKIVVLDEADYLTPDAQAALRNMMEVFSDRTRFILTCNYVERIIPPIISRVQPIALTPPSKKEVAVHLVKILNTKNVAYEKSTVATLVNAYYPDIRRIINTAELQTQNGKLELNISTIISGDLKLQILDVLMGKQPGANKVTAIRQLVADAGVKDYTELYQLLYQKAVEYNPTKIPQTVLSIAEGQFRDAFVVDKEINFVATLYNILLS